jgi:hypothetical protein
LKKTRESLREREKEETKGIGERIKETEGNMCGREEKEI